MRYFTLLLLLTLWTLPVEAQDDPDRGDFRILVISDLNSSYGSTDYSWRIDSTIARIPRLWNPDLVLAGGDMIAGQSTSLTDENVRAMWAAFDEHVAAPLREMDVPYGFTIGNHDASAQLGYERDRNLAAEYWQEEAHHPGVTFIDGSNFPFYYTFTVGDIFFLAWDASSATVQNLDWVESALASTEAQSAAMRIAVGHLPLYAVAEGRNLGGEVLNQPEVLRDLLQEYDVHTYVSGHHHAYYPGRRGTLELLHAGALGAGERPLLGQTEQSPNTVTVVDIDLDTENTRYMTLEAATLDTIDVSTLPKSLHGINGFVVRRDLSLEDEYSGILSPLHTVNDVSSTASGSVSATVDDGVLHISGEFEGLSSDLAENGGSRAALFAGTNGRPGTRVADVHVNSTDERSGMLSAEVPLDIEGSDLLLAGSYFVAVFSTNYNTGELRAHLLSGTNQPPEPSTVTSPEDSASVVVTGDFGQPLFKPAWETVSDPDGDPITYAYQIAADAEFDDIWYSEGRGPFTSTDLSRRDLHALLVDHGLDEGESVTLYHRVITTDGSLDTFGDPTTMVVSNGQPTSTESEPLQSDFVLHSAYPNPASDEVRLVIEQDRRAQVTVAMHNTLGQTVSETEFGWIPAARQEVILDVASLAAGVYVIRISSSSADGSTSTATQPVTIY